MWLMFKYDCKGGRRRRKKLNTKMKNFTHKKEATCGGKSKSLTQVTKNIRKHDILSIIYEYFLSQTSLFYSFLFI